MGARLVAFYEEASRIGGLDARIRLAKHTSVASMAAAAEKETPATVKRFEEAMVIVRREFATTAQASDAEDHGTRSFGHLYEDLLRDEPSYIHDIKLTAMRCTQAAADAFQIARASLWLYDGDRQAIRCADLYERGTRQHSSGTILAAKDFPAYFKALETERVIAAEDAHGDPRTACFSEPYLKPLGINSMLDVPIWVAGRMTGVVCHEHIGPKRKWATGEIDLAVGVGNIFARALAKG
jgi:hypothetical protein